MNLTNIKTFFATSGDPHETIAMLLEFVATECSYDYLHFHDGNSTNSPMIASLSGSPHNHIKLFSTGNEVN